MSSLTKQEKQYLYNVLKITNTKAQKKYAAISWAILFLGTIGLIVEIMAWVILPDRDIISSLGLIAIGALISGGISRLLSLKGFKFLYPHLNFTAIKNRLNH